MTPNFCSQCGLAYTSEQRLAGYSEPDDSLLCHGCGFRQWDNPLPVSVCVQPVYNPAVPALGLGIAQRAIEPKLGSWCLLGGHIRQGESFEDGAIREFHEETGLSTGALVGITGSYTNGRGHVLVAVEFEPILYDVWATAVLCPENSAFDVMWGRHFPLGPLGFPIHQWIAEAWFTRE